jgi:hypothetical protein
MGVNATSNVTNQTDVYASYSASSTTQADSSSKAADTTATEEAATGVVYDKSDSTTTDTSKATYSINKMSAEDRAALVSQLKADQESRQSQLTSLVQKMLSQQATTYANANDIWSVFANGNFTVDEAAKQQAQQDISEDGYYGVKQTSERLFDFACALAGDDVDKMKEMQEAMAKGFSQATSAWGKDLPDICQQTLDAANKKFEEYYKSKESDTSTDTE